MSMEHLQARPTPREMELRLVCVNVPVETRLTLPRKALKPRASRGRRKKKRERLIYQKNKTSGVEKFFCDREMISKKGVSGKAHFSDRFCFFRYVVLVVLCL